MNAFKITNGLISLQTAYSKFKNSTCCNYKLLATGPTTCTLFADKWFSLARGKVRVVVNCGPLSWKWW